MQLTGSYVTTGHFFFPAVYLSLMLLLTIYRLDLQCEKIKIYVFLWEKKFYLYLILRFQKFVLKGFGLINVKNVFIFLTIYF